MKKNPKSLARNQNTIIATPVPQIVGKWVFSGEEYAQWQSWGEGREKGEEGSGQLGFTTAPATFTLGDGMPTHSLRFSASNH